MPEIPSKPREEVTNAELLIQQIETQKSICDLQATVEKLKSAILGDLSNGDKIGLKARVDRIEDWIVS